MKNNNYKRPQIEVITIELEANVLSSSGGGSGTNNDNDNVKGNDVQSVQYGGLAW